MGFPIRRGESQVFYYCDLQTILKFWLFAAVAAISSFSKQTLFCKSGRSFSLAQCGGNLEEISVEIDPHYYQHANVLIDVTCSKNAL